MTAPDLREPFLHRPAPRCLVTARSQPPSDVRSGPAARRAVWPLRASFEQWALKLLTARSCGRTE